jgi:fatty-acyl-CoA synthase
MTSLYQTASVARQTLTNLARFADQNAIADGTVCWTYRELGEQASRMICVLKSLGLRAGHALAILAGNRAEVLAASVAANLMGMRYTPLHPLAAAEDQAFIIDDAGIDVLIVEPERFGSRARAIRAGAPRLRHILSLGPMSDAFDLSGAMRHTSAQPLIDESDPAAISTVVYTGGTTGRPKGAAHTHRSIQTATLLMAADWDWPTETRYLATTPISHAAGGMLRPVMFRGGYTRLLQGFDAEAFCRTVQEERITCTLLVPTLIYALLDYAERRRFDLSSLETIIYGAAPMAPARLKQALEAFGPVFVQLYGQTEAPQCIATLRKVDHRPDRIDRLGSCGLPGPGVDVKLFDAQMCEVPTGMPGEVCVRGPLVMEGYWNRPEATAEAFRGGWLHTGDVAVRDDDGFLTLVDRTKDLIISGGLNIYPREVEDALLSHEDVAAAAVIGVPDPKWGEAVTAFVVLRGNASATVELLKSLVREKRGAPWAPKTINVVDSLPMTALGKIDRKALRARFWPSEGRQVS